MAESTLAERIIAEVTAGVNTLPSITKALDGKAGTVRTNVNRLVKDGRLVKAENGTYTIGNGEPVVEPEAPAVPAKPVEANGPDAAIVAAAGVAGSTEVTPAKPAKAAGAAYHRLAHVNVVGEQMSGWTVGSQTAMAHGVVGTIREIQARPKHGEDHVRILFVEGGMVRRAPKAQYDAKQAKATTAA